MNRVSFDLEFSLRASPAIVYSFLTDNGNLVRWFCDEIDIEGDQYAFIWQGSSEHATLIDDIEEERVRFHWHDTDENEYFEFRIKKSNFDTKTVIEVTDFCDEDEINEQKDFWFTQLESLRVATGG